MKKSVLFLFSLLIFSTIHAQHTDDDPDKNELRLNVLSFIAFSGLEADYEYLMNEESSLGVSLLVGTGNPDDFYEYRNFSITPYYRQFFSRKYARGFFVEGFAMVLNREVDYYNYLDNDIVREENRSETNVALGISIGGKFLTKNGFVAEVFAGIGRTLSSDDDFYFENIIGRGGISLGYRF